MIAGIERRQDVRGTIRVACHCVKIDHPIERAAAANPPVDRLAFLLLVRVVIPLERLALEGVLEWCQRGADDAHPVEVSTRYQLLVAVNNVVCRWRYLMRRQDSVRPADIVNSHHQNYSVRVRVAQHIAVEAG